MKNITRGGNSTRKTMHRMIIDQMGFSSLNTYNNDEQWAKEIISVIQMVSPLTADITMSISFSFSILSMPFIYHLLHSKTYQNNNNTNR